MRVLRNIVSVLIILLVVAASEAIAANSDERKYDSWKRISEVAIQNYHDGHFAEAASLFKRALVEIKRVAPESNQELFTLARLTDISLRRKNGKQADRNYLKVKALYLKLKAKNKLDKEGIAELDRLADSYEIYMTKQEARREKYLLTCLELRDIVSGDNHKNILGVLRSIVVFYVSRGKYKEAEPYAVRLVRIDQKTRGFETIEVGQELFHLGSIKSNLKKYGEAESYFRQSLAIFMAKDKVLPMLVPNIETELALTLYNAKRYKLASREASEALQLIERHFGTFCKESIKTRQVLAKIEQANGRLEEAAKQREIAIGLVNKFFGINNPMNIYDLKELNRYYQTKGNRKKANSIAKDIKIIEALMKKGRP